MQPGEKFCGGIVKSTTLNGSSLFVVVQMPKGTLKSIRVSLKKRQVSKK